MSLVWGRGGSGHTGETGEHGEFQTIAAVTSAGAAFLRRQMFREAEKIE